MATRRPQLKADLALRKAQGGKPPPPTTEPKSTDEQDEEAERLERARKWLRPTELPGVYLNADGAKVTQDGVLLSIRRAKEIELETIVELGAAPQTPAEFLRRVALDPTRPLHTRVSAAIAAAPYFDRKMPLGIEGGDPERPITTQSTLISGLSKLPAEERKAALALLERLGALG